MKEKTKVIAYIYRNQKSEVLVFAHKDFPEAGLQVVGGTLEKDEKKRMGLSREILEEAGIHVHPEDLKKVGNSTYFRKDKPEVNFRHYFEFESTGLPESWTHSVTSDGADNGLLFDFFWLPIAEAKERLTGDFGELL